MKTVAIISEYNPFHNGHLYQIEKIREEFGEDTAIIAIMSGNFTQRGEIAIMEKWARAKSATLSGVNLVLELPFPYSSSSAELFAKAGVAIANGLGVVDYLSFGSELGDVSQISEIANNMQKEEFKNAINTLLDNEQTLNLGYPKIMELAYNKTFNTELGNDFFRANNILALEYIKALNASSSSIVPHTVKRLGAEYTSSEILQTTNFQSATAIRNLFYNNESAAEYIPISTQKTINEENESCSFPCNIEKLDSAIISFFRLSHPSAKCNIHDADGGLYNRLIGASLEAKDISSLIDLSGTKKYTTARIKRAIWYSFFGVTSSDVKNAPEYTQVLALDTVGQALLKRIRKCGKIRVVTKPSTSFDDEKIARQKMLSDNADFIFQIAKPVAHSVASVYKRSPFVMN